MEYIRPVKILLADDDTIDTELFVEALEATKIPYTLEHVHNGQAVLDHLEDNEKEYPDFILLDLNMPMMNGFQVLTSLKHSPKYFSIPVFIMSTSKAQYDVLECYKAGANLFLTKPVEFDVMVTTFKSILQLFHGSVVIAEIVDLTDWKER